MTISQSSCQRKDMSNMSFVGLHNTKEGIIGFADSKATITLKMVIMKKMFKEEK